MGSLFRSEDMTYVRLYFDNVAAHSTIKELGREEIIQLEDLNSNVSPFQRAHAADVRRCEEMLRKLRYLREQAAGEGLGDVNDAHPDGEGGLSEVTPKLGDLDAFLGALEQSVQEINTHNGYMRERYREMTELQSVLETSLEVFFGPTVQEEPGRRIVESIARRVAKVPVAGEAGADALRSLSEQPSVRDSRNRLVAFVAGVLDTERRAAFEKMVFRATRGNSLIRARDVAEGRTVFLIFFSGEKARQKTERICTAFQGSLYPVPEKREEQLDSLERCREKLREYEAVLGATRNRKLEIVRGYRMQLPEWIRYVEEEKAIYHALNMLNYDTSKSLFIIEGWIAVEDMNRFTECVRRAHINSNAQAPSLVEQYGDRKPGRDGVPTLFRINRFTSVFQSIVESYGIAKYKEVNPAPFAVVTFPFLFAVMFGDVGHGALMAVAGLVLILMEGNLKNRRESSGEFFKMLFDGRYIVFLMGLFSVFTGFIYNEFFAVPMDIFGSRWKYTNESSMACGVDNCEDPAAVLPPLNPYPFGMDPIWKPSETGLAFFNSYKMKLSIVLGVSHMMVGIFNSLLNAKFFRVLFMGSIFGYLVFLIFLKWAINWNSPECQANPQCNPPDLKAIMIGMFMSPGHVAEENVLYPGQAAVQAVLLMLAVVAVPWMLLPRPLLLRRRHRRSKGYKPVNAPADRLEDGSGDPEQDDKGGHGDDEFNFQDVFVEQMIHTIEFVLGAVSNTASYLRLWALSLAHSELSDVFLEKLIFLPVSSGMSAIIVVGFWLWVALTLGVLMGMESLSAFLHALRLHWVEFQNKFYNQHGPGVKFSPLVLRRTEEQ